MEQGQYPYHVTSRCINKEWFSLPIEKIWGIFEDQLFFLNRGFEFRIHAFVLMNNHFHLLVSTPQNNLADGMCYLMKETARQINYESGRINQVWGGRYFRSMIDNQLYFMHAHKYIYRNPLSLESVNDVAEYKYSTLAGILGLRKQIFTVDDNTIDDMGLNKYLDWLNQIPQPENILAIKRGLKKKIFRIAKTDGAKKTLTITNQML